MWSWSEAARLRKVDHFLLLHRFLRLSVNENLLLLSFVSHFFHFVLCMHLRSLGVKSAQYLPQWISAYLIDHFTVVGLVTWPLNGSEAGVDLVLIKTSLLLLCKSSCSYAN